MTIVDQCPYQKIKNGNGRCIIFVIDFLVVHITKYIDLAAGRFEINRMMKKDNDIEARGPGVCSRTWS